MAAIMLSRALGLIRDMVISGLFGQGRNTDIYTAAFKVPDLLFYLVAGGVISAAFVPVLVEYLANGKREDASELFSIIASVMAVVVAGFVIFGEIFARQLVPWVATPGIKDPDSINRIAHLTRIILPCQFCFFMGGLMMAWQWAHQEFAIPGLSPSIYNIGIIAGGAIAGSRLGPQGVEGLAWGALCGAFAGSFLLQFIALRGRGVGFRLNFNARHPGAKKVWILMIPIIFSLSLTYVDVWVNTLFASYLFKGAISALDRANRLMQVPIGILGQSVAIGFYTTLAAQFSTNKVTEFKDTVNYGLRSISFVSIPATVLMIVLRIPLIQLLFQHGHFNAKATTEVAQPLIFFSLGIFAWSAYPLMARAFYSMQQTKIPVIAGTVVTAIFVPLNYVLMNALLHTKFGGLAGLALSTSISGTLNLALLILLLRKSTGGIGFVRLATSLVKTGIASVLLGVGAWVTLKFGMQFVPSHLPLKIIAGLRLLLPTAVGGVLFLLAVHFLKLEESAAAYDMIKRRFGRKKTEEAA